MFLSIIIPIWNDEKYLEECLDSCLDQELSKNEYEIICVDDGSTDRTPEMLREYEERHPNIHVIEKEHTGNGGRSVGYQIAKGDYIWFVDHDDFIAKNAVCDLKQIVSQYPNYDRISFPYYQFYNALSPEEQEKKTAGTIKQNDSNYYQALSVWASIFSNIFLDKNSINPRSTRIGQAEQFWDIHPFRIFGGDMIFVEECMDKGARVFYMKGHPLYFYRHHQNTETLNQSPEVVKKRALLRANSVLVWGYLISQLKEQLLIEKQNGASHDPKVIEKIIDKLRESSGYLLFVPDRLWFRDVRLFAKKGLFIKRRPKEYPLRFRDYYKRLSKKEKLLPHLWAFYFTYTLWGTILYRLLSWPFGFRERNAFLLSQRHKRYSVQLRKTGLGN